MLRFSLFFTLAFFSGLASLLAMGINTPPPYTSQYVKYRSEVTKRTDPRLKHLPNSSKKANKCLQYMMGICTLTEPEDYGRQRYTNGQRRNKVDTTKQLGFQGAEYWSN